MATQGFTKVVICDAAGNAGNIDTSANALLTILQSHHEIHAGHMYTATGGSASLSTTSHHIIRFVAPTSAYVAHAIVGAFGHGESVLKIYETAVFTGSGVAPTVINRNRNSANAPQATCTHSATIQTTGTLIYTEHFGVRKAGGDFASEEFVLKKNTTYAIVLTSEANTNEVDFNITWYEVPV